MKKLFSIVAALMFVGSVMADDVILTLDLAAASTAQNISSLDQDKLLTFLQASVDDATAIKSVGEPTNVYGKKGSGGTGIPGEVLKIGKASEAGAMSFVIADDLQDVKKVSITGYRWDKKTAIKINDAEPTEGFVDEDVKTEVTRDFILSTPAKEIKIDVADAAFCATKIILLSSAATDIENVVVENNAVKRIVNGQVIIERDGVRYNVIGQVIK